MRNVPKARVDSLLVLLLACVSSSPPAACSDDDDDANVIDAGGGRSGAGGAFPSGGTRPEPPTCDPRPDPADDACLSCLADHCCAELVPAIGGQNSQDDYGFYDGFFQCVRTCVEAHGDTDAGSSSRVEDAVLECGPGCTTAGPEQFDYRRADLLACSTGLSRPIPATSAGSGTDFEWSDEDAGIGEANCTDVCFHPL